MRTVEVLKELRRAMLMANSLSLSRLLVPSSMRTIWKINVIFLSLKLLNR